MMKYLIDSRQPITLEDIDWAIEDGIEYLDGSDGSGITDNLISRLVAIVRNAYAIVGDDDA